MQPHRTAGAPPAPPSRPDWWTGKVLGLGVTDVLRVELEPCQLPSVIEQLGLMRVVCEDKFRQDRARLDAIPEFAREGRLPSAVEAETDVDVSEFGLRALDIIRDQVLDRDGEEAAVVIYGPARIIAELVRESTRSVAERLVALLEHRPGRDVDAQAGLVTAAAAAKAWTERYVECEAIEWFAFDIDPAPTGA